MVALKNGLFLHSWKRAGEQHWCHLQPARGLCEAFDALLHAFPPTFCSTAPSNKECRRKWLKKPCFQQSLRLSCIIQRVMRCTYCNYACFVEGSAQGSHGMLQSSVCMERLVVEGEVSTVEMWYHKLYNIMAKYLQLDIIKSKLETHWKQRTVFAQIAYKSAITSSPWA